jgi:hypothetical protein
MVNLGIRSRAGKVAMWTLFDNLAVSSQHSAFSEPKNACNPLPTEQ